jgi:hypothetical protein
MIFFLILMALYLFAFALFLFSEAAPSYVVAAAFAQINIFWGAHLVAWF